MCKQPVEVEQSLLSSSVTRRVCPLRREEEPPHLVCQAILLEPWGLTVDLEGGVPQRGVPALMAAGVEERQDDVHRYIAASSGAYKRIAILVSHYQPVEERPPRAGPYSRR